MANHFVKVKKQSWSERVVDQSAFFKCFNCDKLTNWQLLPTDDSHPGVRCCSIMCQETIEKEEHDQIVKNGVRGGDGNAAAEGGHNGDYILQTPVDTSSGGNTGLGGRGTLTDSDQQVLEPVPTEFPASTN